MAHEDTASSTRPDTSAGRGRRILLGWELGEGLGHAARLLRIASRLKALGWSPVVAARHPETLAERHAAQGIPVVAAPAHRSCFHGPGPFQAASYADVMGVCGYADRAMLAAVVAAWDRLLDRHSPEVVIADYAPLLSLAAYGRAPLISVGDGFVTPHGLPDGTFPALRNEAPPMWNPRALLDAACEVQAARRLPPPRNLPEIVEGAAQVVCVWPELDIYGATRHCPAAGPWDAPPPPLPPPAGMHVFCYLHLGHPCARLVLQWLARERIPGECYLHEATPQAVAALERAGIQVHREPPPLRTALARASLLIHHGGIGSLEDALVAGRPQLLLPRHLEQWLNARRAVDAFRGVLAMRQPATIPLLHRHLPGLLGRAEPLAAAQQTAARLAERQGTAWGVLQRALAHVTHDMR